MIVYRCPGCGSNIRTDDSQDLKTYREVLLDGPCDYCKLIVKEGTSEMKELLETVFGGSK